MRKIIVGEFVSLDGVSEAPEKWTFQYFTDEIQAHIGSTTAASGGLLLGRVTYEGFAAAFSSGTGPDADAMNKIRKYVVSSTLKKADWKNSTLINGKTALEDIRKLKQEPGNDLTMSGSLTLVQSLLSADLIDELQLLVYPVVVGGGKRLFKDGDGMKSLKLIGTKAFSSGVVLLRYEPERKA